VSYQYQQPRTSPVTAVIAALLALSVTAFEIVLLVRAFDVVNFATLGDQPPQVLALLGSQAVAGVVLLLGAMFTFARKMAGTVLVVIGSVLALATFFLVPLLNMIPLGFYLESVFEFATSSQVFQALTLVVSPIALLMSLLPPTLNYLREGRDDHYDPYSGGGGSGQQSGFPDVPGFHQPNLPHVPGMPNMPNLPNVPNIPTNLPRPPRMPAVRSYPTGDSG
jgi:hypothetical protein